MALRHFSALMVLFKGVAIGLVDGAMAPITPTGFAISISPFSESSLITPTVFTPRRSRSNPIVLR